MVTESTLSTASTSASAPPSPYTSVSGIRWSSTPAAVSLDTGTVTMLPPDSSFGFHTNIAMLVRWFESSTVASMPTGVTGIGTVTTAWFLAPWYRMSAFAPV